MVLKPPRFQESGFGEPGETGSIRFLAGGLARFAVGESIIRRLGSRARLVTTPSLLGMTLRVWLLPVCCSLCLAKPACESGTVCSEEEVEAWEEKKHGIRYVQMVCVCFFCSSYRLGDLSGFERANTTPMQVFFSDLILYAAWSHFSDYSEGELVQWLPSFISDRYFDPCAVGIIFHGCFRTCAFPSHLTLRIPSLELLQVSLETQKTETPPHPAIIGCFGGDKPVSVGCLNGSCTYRCISASTGLQNQAITQFYIMYNAHYVLIMHVHCILCIYCNIYSCGCL